MRLPRNEGTCTGTRDFREPQFWFPVGAVEDNTPRVEVSAASVPCRSSSYRGVATAADSASDRHRLVVVFAPPYF